MQSKELIKYIRNPELLGPESIPGLQKLVQDFPYFQPAYILLSLAARKWDASVYQQSIKKTAIVVSNREHLYRLIHQSDLEPEIAVAEEKYEAVAEFRKEKEEAVVETPAEDKVEEKTERAPEKRDEAQNSEPVLNVREKKTELGAEEKTIPYLQPEVTEETIEKEIGKALVNSILETEMLHNAEEKEEIKGDVPENFGDWLQFLRKKGKHEDPQVAEKQEEPKVKKLPEKPEPEKISAKQKQKALIDRIIESNPGIIRSKEDQKFFKSDTKAKESLLENEHLVTETLAKIYALQGNINKAVRAYEILSLKFPQKSAYFASLIQKLKEKE